MRDIKSVSAQVVDPAMMVHSVLGSGLKRMANKLRTLRVPPFPSR
jgi:hypothetical protein